LSRTYRLFKYEKGKPIFTRNERKDMTYHFYLHERPKIRRVINRSRRHKIKQRFKKFGFVEKFFKTQGWESW